MRPVIYLFCLLCIPGIAKAQLTPRIGGFIGTEFSEQVYLFRGARYDLDQWQTRTLGLAVEQPFSRTLSVVLQPQLTQYSGLVFFYGREYEGTDPVYHSVIMNQRWMVEVPITLRAHLDLGMLTPFFSAGAFLAVATPSEHVWINHSSSLGTSYEEYDLPAFHGGATVSAGFEFAPFDGFLLTMEFAATQLFRRSLDVPQLAQDNTTRYQLRFGVLFPLSAEEWK
ncbi:MAG: hypothetical protein IH600_00880 [Bacteroidetes bacterium]|nr:hypothetical protein [Bacteroidota bacterium]